MINTLKNLAILGALLKFAADGAGAFALDNFLARKNYAEANRLSEDAPQTASA